MPEHFRSTVGVFSSAGGRWLTDKAINVRAVEPAPDLPAAQRGSLYMLIEVVGGRGADRLMYRQMLDAAQAAFYGMGDTVDVAMRQAVRSVHTLLRHANEADQTANLRAGMTIVMRYADQLVVAQSGPALAVLSHRDGVDQFPERLNRWSAPLGGDERPEVVLYDASIESGSNLIIGSSNWPQATKPETLAIASAGADVSLATQYLSQVAGNAELSALLVGFEGDIPAVQQADYRLTQRPGSPPPTGAPEQEEEKPRGGLFGGLFGRSRSTHEEAEPPESATRGSDVDYVAPPAAQVGAQYAAPAAPVSQYEESVKRVTTSPRSETLPASPAQPLETEWQPDNWEAETAPEKNASIRRASFRMTRREAPVAAYDADSSVETAARVERSPRRSAWPLVLALVILPLLIIGVVVSMLLTRTRMAEAQFTEKISGAAGVIAQAETLQDDNAASEKLTEARDFLDSAKALRPQDPRLEEQQTRYEAVLNRVEHISPLYGIVPLWDFKSEGRKLTRVIASGDSVFVLDSGRGEVQRFIRSPLGDSVTPANENATPLLARGTAVGDRTVTDLIDMVWSPAAAANQRSLLLTLESGRALVGYDAVYGVKDLPVGSTSKWVEGRLISGYGGNLYVADTGGSQIWRYRPEGDGYAGEPEPYFKNSNNLAGLVSMAIDGNIWLLFSDGRLLKFLSGEQPQFALQGMPNGFSNPVALSVPQEGNRMYVADPGNSRIVELTKDGQFIRQFKAREGDILKNMVHLYLDEAGGMFYILTPDQLYKAIVPDPAE